MDTPEKTSQNRTNQQKEPYSFIALCMAVFLLILLISNLSVVNSWLRVVLSILRPILIGLITAYLASPFFRIFEHKILFRVKPPFLRRVLSLLLTYLSLLLILAVLVMLIVPQLYDSTVNFIANFDSHLDLLINNTNRFLSALNQRLPPKADGSPAIMLLDATHIQKFFLGLWNSVIDFFKDSLNSYNFSYLFDILGRATTVITDTIFGFFVSLYLLNSKEKRYAQIMRFRTAFFSDTFNKRLTEVISIADRSFGSFLRGKIIDSTIVGILTYVACVIFRIPYPVLIGAIVGITDIVPVIGPLIGTVPAGLIIFLTEPLKVIPFVIAIVVIQQIDGNIIAPKILGNQVGVSSLCVLTAIIVMGNLWGLAGMLLGVPVFATLIEYAKKYLEKRLRERQLPDDVESYYNPETLAEISDRKESKPAKKGLFRMRISPPTQETDGYGNMTDLERKQLGTFEIAKKYSLFEELTDEALQKFAAETEGALPVGSFSRVFPEGGGKEA